MPKQSTLLTVAALAAALSLPAVAQGTTGTAASQAQTQSQAQAQTPANPNAAPASQSATATNQPPLAAPVKQGFWGRLNPFARKKYVQGQLQPIRDRANELDTLTADNAKSINDLDARSKAGIAAAQQQAQQADAAASQAQQQVQQDSDQAGQLDQQVTQANGKLQNVDQYQVAQTAELHFKPGPAKLNPSAEQQLDGFLSGLAGQKGYVVEVTAYSTRKGTAGVAASQDLADTVVRYMVLQHNIPLYRIYTMGMGNATPAQMNAESETGTARQTSGGTVEIKVLKNSLAGQ